MLKKVLLSVVSILIVCVIGFAVVVAMQPAEYSISRTAMIAAPVSEVFPHVNELKKWEAWSPWAKLDPNAEMYYEGPAAGTGAVTGWSGNDQIGEGKMTITESNPNELVRFRLEFVRPMEDSATVEFAFAPQGDGTVVTWKMFGENNFVAKAICLFMDLDEAVGGQMEEGLAGIKAIAEKSGKGAGASGGSEERESGQG